MCIKHLSQHARVVHGQCCHVQEPEVAEEQLSAADAAVTVSSETPAPASKAEAAEKPVSKAPARNTRIAAPAAKIRLGTKSVPCASLSAAFLEHCGAMCLVNHHEQQACGPSACEHDQAQYVFLADVRMAGRC